MHECTEHERKRATRRRALIARRLAARAAAGGDGMTRGGGPSPLQAHRGRVSVEGSMRRHTPGHCPRRAVNRSEQTGQSTSEGCARAVVGTAVQMPQDASPAPPNASSEAKPFALCPDDAYWAPCHYGDLVPGARLRQRQGSDWEYGATELETPEGGPECDYWEFVGFEGSFFAIATAEVARGTPEGQIAGMEVLRDRQCDEVRTMPQGWTTERGWWWDL